MANVVGNDWLTAPLIATTSELDKFDTSAGALALKPVIVASVKLVPGLRHAIRLCISSSAYWGSSWSTRSFNSDGALSQSQDTVFAKSKGLFADLLRFPLIKDSCFSRCASTGDMLQ